MVVAIDEDGGLRVRSYDEKRDWARVDALERRCQVVGPSDRISIFIDTLGDPICRIRNSPSYNILVAELGKDLVGVVQGTVKVVAVHRPPPKDKAKTGYILGLRVSPDHRRRGVASALVRSLEQWFISNHIEFSYMATEEANVASVRLFVGRLGYVRFRTPSILVYPVNACRRRLRYRIMSNVEIRRLGTESAESVYRRFVSTSSDFFPDDIDRILKSRLNLGTWVAHFGDDTWLDDGVGSASWRAPGTWAMLSAWDTSQVFKLRLGKAPLSFRLFTRVTRLINNNLPCLGMPAIPDFFRSFGFYFIYGVYGEGKSAGELIRALCRHVQRLAGESEDCRAVVTEVGETDKVGFHIPRWKLLSCPRDLWCMKPLKPDDDKEHVFSSLTRALFVDPREAGFSFATTAYMCFMFSVTTPLGIVLGMIVFSLTGYDDSSMHALIMEGLLGSLSSGILIYTALVALIAADFFHNKLMSSTTWLKKASFIALCLGSTTMSILAIWA